MTIPGEKRAALKTATKPNQSKPNPRRRAALGCSTCEVQVEDVPKPVCGAGSLPIRGTWTVLEDSVPTSGPGNPSTP